MTDLLGSTRSTVSVVGYCSGCGACLATCPERALRPDRCGPIVLPDRCTTCLACVEICPTGAIAEVPR